MSLTKVNYVAEETVISTQNLNNIQDSVIALQANAETGSTLTKVNYVDKETKISAKNLNDIQDAIIALENNSGGSSANIQESKSVTITSNGTTTITPDTGYDALGKVDVTVDVASGEGGTCKLKINVTQPPSDDPEWFLCIARLTDSPDVTDDITLDANSPSAEISIPDNGLFVLYTPDYIDMVDGHDWGFFDALNVATEYVSTDYSGIKTYVCYAGGTGTGIWDIQFR